MKKAVPTTDQIRHAIDTGRGGDKVAFPDPAAAPLGTDDEASGFPITVEQREQAAQQATSSAPKSHSGQWMFLPLVILIPSIVILTALWLGLSAR